MTPARRRAYRLLLALFPPAFRREHGADMARLFEDMHAERVRERGRAGPAFWVLLAWDALGQALAERARPSRRTSSSPFGDTMASVLGDVRYAFRQILLHPLYSGTIVLLLAVGIGGNAAVFRLVNGLFLRPLPFADAERLVDLNTAAPEWNLEATSVAWADFVAWREGNRTFDAMAVFTGGGRNLVTDGVAERVAYLGVSHEMDDVLGLVPQVGRFFTAAEDVHDGPAVALVTDAFWTERFGRDAGAVGRSLELDGESYTVIGVLPPEAAYVDEAEVWIPLQADPDGGGYYLGGIGRLRRGVIPERAREDLLAIHKARVEERSQNAVTFPTVAPLRDTYLGDYRMGSGVLLLAVGLVLVMACANIAGLVFARSLTREGEMAVRAALGAGRGRVARQLFTETAVLAALGGTAGTLAGLWGSEAMVRALADRFPRWVVFDLDLRVLLFLAAVTMGAAVLFGLAPALRRPGSGIAPGGRATAGMGRKRWMGLLVAGEVALASLLLVVGGLSVLDAWRLARVDPGYRPEGVLTYRLELPRARYPGTEERQAFADGYVERLEALPGVTSAALAYPLPLTGHWGWFFHVEGAPPRGEDEGNPVVLVRVATPDYLETLGVTLLEGRGFDGFDGRDGRVAMVNETFVRTFFGPGGEAVGRRIATSASPDEDDWMTVVGVVRDVKHYGVDEPMRPGVYWPWPQMALSGFSVAVRGDGDPSALVEPVRKATLAMDPELPPFDVQAMTERVEASLWTRRATSGLLAAFALVALLLAVAGIYGVVSYGVAQRRKEIGIRLAMGASAPAVLRGVVGQGMGTVAGGVALGLAAALAVGSLTSRLLVGVSAREPWVYGAVGALLLAVALAAHWLPARRAAALDPMGTLRGE